MPDLVKLGSVTKCWAGGTPSRSKPENYEGNIPWVKSGEVNSRHVWCTEETISDKALASSSAKICEPGSILVAMYGATAGKVARLMIEAATNQAVLSIRSADSDVLTNDFLFWVLEEKTQSLISLTQGAAQPNLSKGIIEGIQIPLYPLPEQKKIAQILSTWDQAITATERLLENSQRRKKGVMQQLLTGKKRLKGFGGGFKRRKLEDLAEVDARNLDSKTPAEFKFRYISLSDVDFGRINTRLSEHIYKTSPSRARRMVKEGDLLFATVRPNLQGFAKVLDEHDGAVASTGFAVLSPRSHVCGDYLYHYLFSAHVTGQVNSLVAGSNYPAISSGDVKKMLVYCPDLEEQTEIAEILNACDLDVSLLSQRLHILKEQKRALMQKLLTGKRRVQVDTEAA